MVRQSLLLLVLLTTPPFLEATETFSFQSYQQGMLRMTLISPSLEGEAQLRHDKKLEVLTSVMMENLFTMRTEVPCQWLKADSVLYWYLPGRKMLKAKIPAQSCESELPASSPLPSA